MRRELLLCVTLAGCGTITTTTTTPIVAPNVPVAIQNAQPMTLNTVNWQVMTLPQLKQLVAKLEKKNEVVFVLDKESYTNLMLNLVEIKRYLSEQQAILDMLKKIISDRSTQWDVPEEKK